MKSLFPCALLFLCLSFSQAKAQDTFSHDFELASADVGLPLIGDKILDSQPHGYDIWWMSQASYAGACLIYRWGENDPYYWNEFLIIDLPSIGVSALIEVLFPPAKEK